MGREGRRRALEPLVWPHLATHLVVLGGVLYAIAPAQRLQGRTTSRRAQIDQAVPFQDSTRLRMTPPLLACSPTALHDLAEAHDTP